MSEVKLHLGDCLEFMRTLPDMSVDLVLADLPYGTTQNSWDSVIPFASLWDAFERVVRPNAAIALFGAEPFSSALRMSNLQRFKYDWIWQKTHPSNHLNAKRMPMRVHETISIFSFGTPPYYPIMTSGHAHKVARAKYSRRGDSCYGNEKRNTLYDSTIRYPQDIIEIGNGDKAKRLHPSEKPVALMQYFIETYSTVGETVLDCTFGSGTTGVACVQTGRNFIGCEIDPDYFAIAEKRINDALQHVRLPLEVPV